MEKHVILLIEDEAGIAETVTWALSTEGFEPLWAATGGEGLELAAARSPALVIIDVGLPDMSGFDVLRTLRKRSEPPVIVLTARGEETDRIVGLELGADDYLTKPFNPRELLARLRAILRRRGAGSDQDRAGELLRFGRLTIDLGARAVRVAGEPRALTSHQFDLLVALGQRAGRVQSRDQLMHAVRGHDLDAFDRSIDVHVSRIRAAIEDDPKSPKRILTVRGVGYVFAARQD